MAETTSRAPDATEGPAEKESCKNNRRLWFDCQAISSALMAAISRFKGINPEPVTTTTTADVLEEIRSEKHADIIKKIRATADKEQRNAIKKKLPAVTFSCQLRYRALRENSDKPKAGPQNLINTTGLYINDLDGLPNPASTKEQLAADRNIAFAFDSPGGGGLKIGVFVEGIRTISDHERVFPAVQRYMREAHDLEIDAACRNMDRLCYLSHDPHLIVNHDAIPFNPAPWLKTALKNTGSDHDHPPKSERAPGWNSKHGRKILDTACYKIRDAAPGDMHITRRNQARIVGGFIASGYIDEAEAIAALERAVGESNTQNFNAAWKTILDGVEYGKRAPLEPDFVTIGDGCFSDPSHRKAPNDMACDGYDGCDGFSGVNIFTLPEPPLSVFKSDIRYVLENISESKRCPIEIPIAGLLAVCSGLTGLSRKIQIKRGWTEPGNIYTALVAKSATGKGPGIHPLFRSLYAIEKAEHERYTKEHEGYEIALNVWQSSKRDHPEQPRPKPPGRKDRIIDDATIEAVADSLISNPRGILWNRDELSGLFRDFDKYSGERGATKERLMSAYDAVVPWKLNRATGRQVGYIPNPCISIFGTIQTSVLGNTFTANDKNSGLLGRWIFIHAVPTVAPTFSDEEESLKTKNIIERLIHGLDRLPFEGEPRIVNVSSEAKQEYIRWHDKLALEAWLSTDDGEGGLLSKVRAQGLRICLLLHLMDSVLSGQPEKSIVDADTMVRALRLMDWLKAHSQATWRFLGDKVKAPTGHEVRVAQAILDIQDKIYNSWLSTAEITKKCNHGHDDQYHLKTNQVGKICTRLSLEKKATAAAKGFVVTPADIERLSIFNPRKTVTTVTSVNPPNDGGFGYDGSDYQPSLTVIKEGACDDIEVF